VLTCCKTPINQSVNLGSNSLNSGDVPLSNKQANNNVLIVYCGIAYGVYRLTSCGKDAVISSASCLFTLCCISMVQLVYHASCACQPTTPVYENGLC